MILFKKMRWKNMLSTGNVFTEFDLNVKDMTLIVGQNGAGKSTILDALSFVLFGKPFRKINKPQLVNSITQKNMVVEIEFTIGTNQYKIIRGMKPTIFEVYQNGSLLNQSAEMKDYQEILEKQILKVNHKSFNQVVVLGSATFQPFMQLTPGSRREIIEDLLDLQIFTTMNSLLKDKVLINDEYIMRIVSDKKIIQSKIEMTKEHLKELQSNNDQLIEEKKNKINDIKKQIKTFDKEYSNFDKKRKELDEKNIDSKVLTSKLTKLSQLKHQIEANLSVIKNDVDFFKNHDNCPTCKQVIDENFRKDTISDKEIKIVEINEGLEKLSEQYNQINEQISEAMKIQSELNDVKMEINLTKTKINSLTAQKDDLEQEIKQIHDKKNVDSDDKIQTLETELKEIEKAYNVRLEEKEILSVAGTLLKDNGIKAKIIKQYVPVINKLINKYLSSMDFFVSFELDEQFNESIKSRYRDDFTYASFSEGEKQKIDLALLFTWRAVAKLRNSINTNLLIMDEVFDSSLDQNATDYLMNIIRDVSKDSNIIIISHKEHMNEKFTNVVKFVKHKNFSQIQD